MKCFVFAIMLSAVAVLSSSSMVVHAANERPEAQDVVANGLVAAYEPLLFELSPVSNIGNVSAGSLVGIWRRYDGQSYQILFPDGSFTVVARNLTYMAPPQPNFPPIAVIPANFGHYRWSSVGNVLRLTSYNLQFEHLMPKSESVFLISVEGNTKTTQRIARNILEELAETTVWHRVDGITP